MMMMMMMIMIRFNVVSQEFNFALIYNNATAFGFLMPSGRDRTKMVGSIWALNVYSWRRHCVAPCRLPAVQNPSHLC